MRFFAVADPPYPGQSAIHYKDHEDYAGEVDHAELIQRLMDEYDGWALHTNEPNLGKLLNLVPESSRIGVWCKSFASWKRNVYPAYAWEPVIFYGCRNVYGERQTIPDFIVEPITLQKGLSGVKPERVCHWVFDFLGARPDDELDDLFPGTGAVSSAWEAYKNRLRLDFPVELENEPLEGLA